MYKLKHVARRGSSLVAAVGLLGGIGASAIPGIASADALNPLTERSLTLSSSSPGWSYKDGSGNATYAPPNSGANGQKTGNFFTFKPSTATTTIKAITFQYCTTPAGECTAPGDNAYITGTPDTRGNDTATTSDLNVVAPSATEISDANWTTIQGRHSSPGPSSDLYAMTPDHDGSEGNFVLLKGGTRTSGWDMSASNRETNTVAAHDGTHDATGKNNFIVITNSTGVSMNTGDKIDALFFGTDANYITNPGSGSFFVRINTYSDDTTQNDTTLVDGGVTVANVMNESISIQTKVLETMDFSVGIKDPNTYTEAVLTSRGLPPLGQCSALLMADPLAAGVTDATTYSAQPHNVLKLGDSTAEYSLKTNRDYTVDSYWRLSSNSSGGATVYYTGHTLTNTVGDEITPMNDTTAGGTASVPGTEQFGLGLVQNNTAGSYAVTGDTYGTNDGNNSTYNGTFEDYVANGPSGLGIRDAYAHLPRLAPLVPEANYRNAGDATPRYAFTSDADTYTQKIATESTDVVNCVTAKMRYVANIAATTPAGIYTTKINYVASPQY